MNMPQLTTKLSEPFYSVEQHILRERKNIEAWFESEWKKVNPPVYGSLDLRNAGFKLAPIDMNLFPAGFNNLNPNLLSVSVKIARNTILRFAPETKRILIIPENHTRNLFYWENIKVIQTILEQAGFQTRVGFLLNDLTTDKTIELRSGGEVLLQPLQRKDNTLYVEGFEPDFILLNNDLSEGVPEILKDVDQPLYPSTELGWHQRLKSEYFRCYANVCDEFAKHFSFDPWAIAPLFRRCSNVNFMQQEGMQCLSVHVEELFVEIQKKYDQYGIKEKPFVIVKADAGTYGMAVMTVRDMTELKNMNRDQRKRMASTKGGQPVQQVIVQEGVYTFEVHGPEQSVAEPVVYLWGTCVAGGFYRVHQDRGVDESLNAPGAHFEPIAFARTCDEPEENAALESCPNLLYTYGVIARLSMLAAAHEAANQARNTHD